MKEKQRETVVAGEEPTKYPHGSTQHWPKPTAKQEGGRGEQKGNQKHNKKKETEATQSQNRTALLTGQTPQNGLSALGGNKGKIKT